MKKGIKQSYWTIIFKAVVAVSFLLPVGANAKLPSVDQHFKPRLGKYHYKVELNNMDIGQATILINRDRDLYKIFVEGNSVGLADKIFRLRYHSEAILQAEPLTPVETKINQQYRSNRKETVIKFRDDGTIKAVETRWKKGKQVECDVRELQAERFTLDPFTAAYLVRGFDWEAGAQKIFVVYSGKNQYELKLECENIFDMDVEEEKRKAWVISATVRNLDPEKQREAMEKKKTVTASRIYVSADKLKDVLKIEASHKMGEFTALMVDFNPVSGFAEAAPGSGGKGRSTDEG